MSKPNSHYPPLLIIPPTSGTHKSTYIILHGRGSTAEKFATPLLSHLVSPAQNSTADSQPQIFQTYFPNTKFIFPTASRRRAVAYNRSLIHQWFDLYPLDQYTPEHREHIQLAGLKESAEFVHGLLEEAVQEVGASNVVLMGLSQGCAVGLVSLLLWKGQQLGGFVGMCGWLPLRKSMLELVEEVGGVGDSDDVFEIDENERGKTGLEAAIEWLGEEVGFQTLNTTMRVEKCSFHETPVFLGHGAQDQKVPCELGTLAAEFLREVDIDVSHQEYATLGHWYSADMLRDVVQWLKHWVD